MHYIYTFYTNYSYTLGVHFLTSWDDGYTLDLRIADLLDRYGLQGTFYICPHAQHGAQMLSREQIASLSGRHRIGAHSMTHPNLTEIAAADAEREISESKQWVEDETGKPCTAFCYPYGAVNNAVKNAVKEAGFTEARTTEDLAFSAVDPFLQPVSLQIAPFPMRMRFHPLWKALDPLGPLRSRYRKLRSIGTPYSAMMSWVALAKSLYIHAKNTKQEFFHLYGHSREVEKYGMWGDLEDFLRFVRECSK